MLRRHDTACAAGVTRRQALTTLLSLSATAAVPALTFGQTRVAARIDAGSHPLVAAMAYARKGLEALEGVQDYTGTFRKQELVGGALSDVVTEVKFREKPFSVYLKFTRPYAGREVLYVDGQNDGKLLAHEGGLRSIAGTFAFDPTSARAMEGNRYPITLFGMKKMLLLTLEQWEADVKLGGGGVQYFPQAKIGEIDTKVIESTQPTKLDGTKFHVTRLYLDRRTNLPIRVQQYDFPATAGGDKVLVEEYTYLDLKTNVGLTDADFDRANPNYAF